MTNRAPRPGSPAGDGDEARAAVPAPRTNREMEARIRAFDWSGTDLGPIASWPQSLRTAVDIVLRSPVPLIILWGRDGIMIYNDGYAEISGNKHPGILGARVLEAWPEVADFNRQVMNVGLGGEALTFRDRHLVLNRAGVPEDMWFDLNYSPILDEQGRPAGIMAIVLDTTRRVLEERRTRETEERLQLALDAAGMIGVCDYNFQTGVVLADARFATMFGVDAAAAHGAPLSAYLAGIHPDDYAATMTAIRRTINTRQPFSHECRLLRRDGDDIRWVFGRGAIFQDGEGNWARFLVVVVDITEQKRTEAALRASQTELQRITDEMPELVSYLDRDLHYRFVNHAYEEWLNLPRERILDRHVRDVLGDGAFEERRAWLERTLNGEELAFEATLTIRGRSRDTEVRLFPRRDGNGNAIGTYEFVLDISDRKRADRALRQLNQGLEQLVADRTRERDNIWKLSQDPFLIADSEGRWLSVSPAWTRILGWSESDLLGHTSEWMEHPDDRQAAREDGRLLAAGSTPLRFENRFRHKDGSYRWFSWTAVPDGGFLYCVARDITAEKQRQHELEQTQEQLRQAQKMEAIGQLTGGIAHDFNNMLTGITGALELLQRRIEAGRLEGLDRYINTAITSANRAAALTHRLLAFSRRQPLDLQPTDVNSLVVSLEDLLHRTLGEHIALELVLNANLRLAKTDANQVENALLNLCINARDAMPDGGKLTIETMNTTLSNLNTREFEELEPGDYVMLAVTDTGAGMPPEVVARVFDPFFTTKPIGQGTGLGLSTIYGFVRQTGGHVRVYSEVGQGTTVNLYFPVDTTARDRISQVTTTEWPRAQASETVLLVEDDIAVRMVVMDVLAELGYTVLEAAEPQGALAHLDSGQEIDLLIADVGLPGMNGRQLAEIARRTRPGLRVLFVTGYAEGGARSGLLDPGMDMIGKPFDIDTLATKIRSILSPASDHNQA